MVKGESLRHGGDFLRKMIKRYEIKIGATYGEYTILHSLPNRVRGIHEYRMVRCRCSCGAIKDILFLPIASGKTISCGCYRKEKIKGRATKHGLHKHPLHKVWRGIKDRCHNPNSYAYKDYGGRGIHMSPEWRSDFKKFYNWCLSSGWIRGKEIDRIDNNGDYKSINCRITDRKGNMRNTRRNNIIEHDGKSMCITDWADYYGIHINTIRHRIKKGWDKSDWFNPILRQYSRAK